MNMHVRACLSACTQPRKTLHAYMAQLRLQARNQPSNLGGSHHLLPHPLINLSQTRISVRILMDVVDGDILLQLYHETF